MPTPSLSTLRSAASVRLTLARALLLSTMLFAACDGGGIGNAVIPQVPGNGDGGGGAGGGGTGTVQGQDIDALGSDVVTAINGARTPLGLAALTVDRKLVAAAQLQANQMKQTGVFQHTISGVGYPTITDRVDATGYAWSAVGENLATGTDAATIVTGWLGTTADRANILSASHTAVGVAEVVNGVGTQLVVAVFAKPKS
jgi:uncharacterized protein YkwD